MEPIRVKTRVADVMSYPVVVIDSDATMRDAARVLSSAGVSGAPVVDRQGRPLGMLTEADILGIFQKKAGLAKVVPAPESFGLLRVLSLEAVRKEVVEGFDAMPVARAMSAPVAVTSPDMPLDEAVEGELAPVGEPDQSRRGVDALRGPHDQPHLLREELPLGPDEAGDVHPGERDVEEPRLVDVVPGPVHQGDLHRALPPPLREEVRHDVAAVPAAEDEHSRGVSARPAALSASS
jgi:CBS domain-containing protein